MAYKHNFQVVNTMQYSNLALAFVTTPNTQATMQTTARLGPPTRRYRCMLVDSALADATR